MSSAPTTSSVQAAVRVRPLNTREVRANASECISLIPGTAQVVLGADRAFTFDHVFGADAAQRSVYDKAVAPLTAKFLQGFHATILAYGQTGSGKTFSMGTALDGNIHTEHQGIVPRAVRAIFADLPRLYPPPAVFTVTVSFLELYNEEVVDLLNPPAHRDANPLPFAASSGRARTDSVRIREENGVIVWAGAREEECKTPDEVLSFLAKGSLNRTVGSTDMNMVSSRSHAIFSVTLRLTKVGADGIAERIACKFHFVDLAGSERLKKTHAAGTRAKEGISINAGLLALGNVISALGDETRLERGTVVHVPYRDSKLTRLLQDSLGGNAQTLMLACVSPADSNFQETLNTLKYANRARNIKNKVAINAQVAGASPMEVQQLRAQIAKLKVELATVRDQYGLFGAVPTPSTPTATADPALCAKVSMLEAVKQQLEARVHQLQKRIRSLEQGLTRAQAERDTLLLEQHETGIRHRASLGDVHAPTAADGPARSIPEPNPLVLEYLTKITHLQHDLHEREVELTALKHQAAAVSSAMAATNASAVAGGGSVPASPARFRFSIAGSTDSAGWETESDDVHEDDDDDDDALHPDLDGDGGENLMEMTLERARSAPHHDDDEDEESDGEEGDTAAKAYDEHAKDPDQALVDLSREFDSPLGIETMHVPAWTDTPGAPLSASAPAPTSSSSSLSRAPRAPSSTNGSESATAWSDAPSSLATSVQPAKSLYQALHKIQANISVHEDLMVELDKTRRSYLALKSEYDEQLRNAQAQLAALEAERDAALAQIAATERDKEREVRAKYETKVKQLSSDLNALKKAQRDAARLVNQAKQSEFVVRRMKASVDALKSERQRLLQKMREEQGKAREQVQATERELQKMRRKERLAVESAKKWERNFELQKILLKRRNDEILATQRKLKDMSAKLKRPSGSHGGAPMYRRPASVMSGSTGYGHARRLSAASSVSSLHDQLDDPMFEMRKFQLAKDMEAVVLSLQRAQQLNTLHAKRTRLYGDRAELMDERERMVRASVDAAGGIEPDHVTPYYIDERLELIDAEIAYLDDRIRLTQAEINQDDYDADAAEPIDSSRGRPSDSSPYERLCHLLYALPRNETLPLLHQTVDELIETRAAARNQAVEVRDLEQQNAELRKNLLLMRSAALQTAVEYEKRLKLRDMNQFFAAQEGPSASAGGFEHSAASSEVGELDIEADCAATQAAVERLMQFSVFSSPVMAPAASRPTTAVRADSRPRHVSSLSSVSSASLSRPGSPQLTLSIGSRSYDDDLSSSSSSSASMSSPVVGSPLRSEFGAGTYRAPRPAPLRAPAVADRRGSDSSLAPAPSGVRRASSHGSIPPAAPFDPQVDHGLTRARRLSQNAPMSRASTPVPVSPRDAVFRRSTILPAAPASPHTPVRRTSHGSLSTAAAAGGGVGGASPAGSRRSSISSLHSPTSSVFERLASTPTAATLAKAHDPISPTSRPGTPGLGARRGSGRHLTPLVTSRPATPMMTLGHDPWGGDAPRSPTPRARLDAPRPHLPTPPTSRTMSPTPARTHVPAYSAAHPAPTMLSESDMW
ncbi:hypothetical protein AMAG_03471 [Allomyces macrogynus ATCC 38327]|uniref:Kinesin motor domain-containing protein n=1 Tax=Allomyces macrogynus (strain ATCC 38327) TaxID=578462 RepID=A0A0L0S9R6_ALLM3|nr:hypothetical protein AMAG_03471 [Allomyces macrogynus ATCC 38327]|eukprot:KNE59135.1 hypothetical protein AMAG_03471 [Allomyces macrogynus ATCC 38327]